MKYQIILLLVLTLTAGRRMGCSRQDAFQEWQALIRNHQQLYPEMQIEDVYKLIYQGIRGPAHLGSDPEKIKEYLMQELQTIKGDPHRRLIEIIAPDSYFVRIDLYRFKADEGDIEKLTRIIGVSATTVDRNSKQLVKIWKAVRDWIKKGKISFDMEAYRHLSLYLEHNNYPVVHHSARYRQAYQPAYRVVARSVWEKEYSTLL